VAARRAGGRPDAWRARRAAVEPDADLHDDNAVIEGRCEMTQAWQLKPGALSPSAIAFTGAATCWWVPAGVTIDATAQVRDELAGPNAPPVAQSSVTVQPLSYPCRASFALTPTVNAPKRGHTYVATGYSTTSSGHAAADAVEPVYVVPQCQSHHPDPFGSGLRNGFDQANEQCQLTETVAVP
jgi:hypothetical protein